MLALVPRQFYGTYLKGRQLGGYKFRRQHSIGNYIVDFFCFEKQIAIELDGEYHFRPRGQIQDQVREEWLNSQGIKVLRFENKLIFHHLDQVLYQILTELNSSP